VSIDAEHQKVTVSGNVDSATLIKKLGRSGKHAELWPQKSNNNHNHHNTSNPKGNNQQANNKDGSKNNNHHPNKGQGHGQPPPNQALLQGLKTFKNQHNKLEAFSSDDDYDCFDDQDNEDDDDEIKFLNLLKQANNSAAAAGAKKNGCNNNGGGANGGNAGGKKVNQNQPAPKGPNGSDPKATNGALNMKMGNPAALLGAPNMKMGNPAAVLGLGNNNPMGVGEAKRAGDLNAMMNLGGLQGFQPSNVAGHGGGINPQMVNFQGYQNNPSAMMMNLRALNNNSNNPQMMMHPSLQQQQEQQPQIVYNRAPQVPPYTGYYYPYPYYQNPYHFTATTQQQPENGDYGANLFNDENTGSCSVM